MRSIKQIKASRRNFTIMYLTGVLTMLNYLKYNTRNYIIKGRLLSIYTEIEALIDVVKNTNYEHSFYGQTQKDVKYECKESDSQSDAK